MTEDTPRRIAADLRRGWHRFTRTFLPSRRSSRAPANKQRESLPETWEVKSRQPTPFAYSKPDIQGAVKEVALLARTDIMRAAVQVIRSGGEESLHSHDGQDGYWMVLSGRVRFHGPNGVVYGEFGRHEGILIPSGSLYWFEQVGDEDLEILQCLAFDRRGKVRRHNHEPRQLNARPVQRLDLRETGVDRT